MSAAPRIAALVSAVLLIGVVAFWALFALIGGNGFNTAQGSVWLGGNLAGAVLTWIAAPWWAARRCGRWVRAGWSGVAAVAASVLLALALAVLALFATAAIMAGVMEGLR